MQQQEALQQRAKGANLGTTSSRDLILPPQQAGTVGNAALPASEPVFAVSPDRYLGDATVLPSAGALSKTLPSTMLTTYVPSYQSSITSMDGSVATSAADFKEHHLSDCIVPPACAISTSPLSPVCAMAGLTSVPGVTLSFSKDSNRLSIGRVDHGTGLPFPVNSSPIDTRYVAAGGHNIIIDSSGVLWTWGRNDSAGGGGHGSSPIPDSGQLGSAREPGAPASAPAPVSTTEQFSLADSGRYHSAGISTSGKLYTWGLNDFGQLGRDATDSELATCTNGASCHDGNVLQAVSAASDFDQEEFVALATGRYHTVVAAKSGAVYTTGLNFCGNGQVCPVSAWGYMPM
jgi:hypothetical protein